MTTTPSTTVVTSADFKSVIDAITSQISVTSIVEVLAFAAAICIAFVFLWWGVRKVTRMIMSAFKKGKIST